MPETKKIVLGLDIGTQYCYAGYMKEYIEDNKKRYKFQQVVCPRDNIDQKIIENGIPTLFAFDTYNRRFEWGIKAETQLREGARERWVTRSDSLKEIIREALENQRDYPVWVGESHHFSPKALFSEFMNFLAAHIRENIVSFEGEDGWCVDTVVFAYPNLREGDSNDPGEYAKYLKKVIEDVFQGIFANRPEVIDKTEGEIAADCLGKNTKVDNHPSFCTVDIGAGTTDVVVMEWNDENQRYERARWDSESTSIPFGGKAIDKILDGVYDLTIPASSYEYLQTKKWIFGLTEKIAGVFNDAVAEGRLAARARVLREITRNTTFSDRFRDLLRGKRSAITENTIIVLMGGTSAIPQLKNAVAHLLSGTTIVDMNIFDDDHIRDAEIVHLKDWATGCEGITNANFIAYAAASLHLGKPTGQRPMKSYALLDSERNYCFICNNQKVAPDLYYYWSHDELGRAIRWAYQEDEENEIYGTEFKWRQAFFEMVLNNRDSLEMLRIPESNIERYCGENGTLKNSSCIATEETLPQYLDSSGEPKRRYYVGLIYDGRYPTPENKRVHVYLYDTEEKKPHYDADRQIEISWDDFDRQVALSQKGNATLDPNKPSLIETTNISPVSQPTVSTPQQVPKPQPAPPQPTHEPTPQPVSAPQPTHAPTSQPAPASSPTPAPNKEVSERKKDKVLDILSSIVKILVVLALCAFGICCVVYFLELGLPLPFGVIFILGCTGYAVFKIISIIREMSSSR